MLLQFCSRIKLSQPGILHDVVASALRHDVLIKLRQSIAPADDFEADLIILRFALCRYLMRRVRVGASREDEHAI